MAKPSMEGLKWCDAFVSGLHLQWRFPEVMPRTSTRRPKPGPRPPIRLPATPG